MTLFNGHEKSHLDLALTLPGNLLRARLGLAPWQLLCSGFVGKDPDWSVAAAESIAVPAFKIIILHR